MEPQRSAQTILLFTASAFLVGAAASLMALSIFDAPVAGKNQVAAAAAVDHFKGLSIEARAAIVIDVQSGEVLYERNADAQLPLASLTKVPLVLAVIEVLPLDRLITIPYYARGTGSSGALSQGELWRVRDIIDFTLVSSSNAGAEMLAELANSALHERHPSSPADSATLWRMNELARDLGLDQTYFLNASGLDLSTTQSGAYGSARDMALLYAYAAANEPSVFGGTARNELSIHEASGGGSQRVINTNLAQGAISGLILGKTGFTDLAGGNLAIVFDTGLSRPVVAVVLGSSERGRFTDMQKLIEAARKAVTEKTPETDE